MRTAAIVTQYSRKECIFICILRSRNQGSKRPKIAIPVREVASYCTELKSKNSHTGIESALETLQMWNNEPFNKTKLSKLDQGVARLICTWEVARLIPNRHCSE
jgi:hypothetical protein